MFRHHFSTSIRRRQITSKADTTLDLIQRCSEERQQLWRLAGRQKLKPAQRERLIDLPKQLDRLWHIHRTELAVETLFTVLPTDRLHSDTLIDFRAHLTMSMGGGSVWRIEDETADAAHWMPVSAGIKENLLAHADKKAAAKTEKVA